VEPVDVVLSSVGGQVTRDAFELLRDAVGRLVVYGLATGELPAITPKDVFRKGVALIGLRQIYGDPEYFTRHLESVFALTLSGELVPQQGDSWPLAEAATAHKAFESRATTGKLYLLP
jgi:NADPH2:quinone reductase